MFYLTPFASRHCIVTRRQSVTAGAAMPVTSAAIAEAVALANSAHGSVAGTSDARATSSATAAPDSTAEAHTATAVATPGADANATRVDSGSSSSHAAAAVRDIETGAATDNAATQAQNAAQRRSLWPRSFSLSQGIWG